MPAVTSRNPVSTVAVLDAVRVMAVALLVAVKCLDASRGQNPTSDKKKRPRDRGVSLAQLQFGQQARPERALCTAKAAADGVRDSVDDALSVGVSDKVVASTGRIRPKYRKLFAPLPAANAPVAGSP